MIPETLIVINLALPLTWPADTLSTRHFFVAPMLTESYVGPNSDMIHAGVALTAIDKPSFLTASTLSQFRRLSLTALSNRVSEFRRAASYGELEDSSLTGGLAIRSVLHLINGIPADVPLPEAMVLSQQVSLYWDFGPTYAEIAIAEDGGVCVYARAPGSEDVLIDTTLDEMKRSGGLSIPADLRKILVLV